ncbi:MAG: hypothetical protein ABL977_08045 [Candidatus Eisenbacteria bacterium]
MSRTPHERPGRRRNTVLTLALLAALHSPAAAQQLQYPQWVTDGTVRSAAVQGSTLYLGGQFFAVARFVGGAFPCEANGTGTPPVGFPAVRGVVHAIASDGAGGWYLGGAFSAVGGQPRQNLAHIGPGYALTGWSPDVDGEVRALLLDGNTLYAGGMFLHAAGSPRAHLAAFDRHTAALLPWSPAADGDVFALARAGTTTFVGGEFTHIGGATRANLAALDHAGAALPAWSADASAAVRALAMRGTSLYVGGDFTAVAGQPRGHVAELGALTAALDGFDAAADAPVLTLVVSGNTLFAGGDFSAFAGGLRSRLAAIDVNTHALRRVDPAPDAAVRALSVSGNALYLGGDFVTVSGLPRLRAAQLDATTGALRDWDPAVGFPFGTESVHALAAGGARVYLGGSFTVIHSVDRERLAAIDLGTGQVTSWAPHVNGSVDRLLATPERIVVSGVFTSLQDQPRAGLGAIATLDGTLDAWDPQVNGTVRALYAEGSRLYLGGSFSLLAGQPRAYLGAFDLTTGTLLPWDPSPDFEVDVITSDAAQVYVGGAFVNIGGASRPCLAGLDRTTGAATGWIPPVPSGGTDPLVGFVLPRVTAVAALAGRVYAGGTFVRWGNTGRINVAAFETGSALLSSWAPGGTDPLLWSADRRVNDVLVHDGAIVVAGAFSHMGGARANLAAVDAVTGSATGWDPAPNAEVLDLTGDSGSLVALGDFTAAAEGDVPFVARYADAASLDAGPPPPPTRLVLASPAPQPMRAAATLSFVLPVAGEATLELLDVSGRRVRTLAAGMFAAGPHTVSVGRQGLRSGLYFVVLHERRGSAGTRLIVLE